MKLLTALLVLLALACGLMLLIPLLGLVVSIGFSVGWFLIWLLPILIIATSDKTNGWEKLAWILAIVFLSWFAWVFYFLLAPIKPIAEYRRRPAYRPYR